MVEDDQILRRLLEYLGAFGFLILGFTVYSPGQASAFILFSTQTVTGMAVPNATGLGNGLLPFILPIAVMGLFALLFRFLNLGGEVNSFIIKFSLFVGCLFGMLSLTNVTPTYIPFFFALDTGSFMLTYLWKRS